MLGSFLCICRRPRSVADPLLTGPGLWVAWSLHLYRMKSEASRRHVECFSSNAVFTYCRVLIFFHRTARRNPGTSCEPTTGKALLFSLRSHQKAASGGSTWPCLRSAGGPTGRDTSSVGVETSRSCSSFAPRSD